MQRVFAMLHAKLIPAIALLLVTFGSLLPAHAQVLGPYGVTTIGTIQINSPSPGSAVSGVVSLTGYAADCIGGSPAQQVTIYQGGPNGTLLGNATLNTGNVDIGTLCGAGYGASVPAGWSYTLDTSQAGTGSLQYTAVATVSLGTAQETVTYNVGAAAASIPGVTSTVNCNPLYPSFGSSFVNNVPCTGPGSPSAAGAVTSSTTVSSTTVTASAACNPYYPAYTASYPNNIPCAQTSIAPGYLGYGGYQGYGSCPPYAPNPYGPTFFSPYANHPGCGGVQFGTLSSPTNVTAAQIAAGTAGIGWSLVNGATGYTIAMISPTSVTESTTSSGSVAVGGLTVGQSYTFSVTAVGPGGTSSPAASNAVTISY